jgi:uncharacterized protein DUF3560
VTRRERLERKAERRLEWAAKAKARSGAAFERARVVADGIPLGQPILVGHHSERRHRRDIARIDSGMSKGVEEARKAESHVSKAGGLEDQLERSVFSDDPDAVVRLKERAAELTAAADRMVAANRAFRKATGADSAAKLAVLVEAGTLTRAEALSVAHTWALCPYHAGQPYPSYATSNMRARARAALERVKDVERRAERAAEAEDAPGGLVVKRYEEHGWCTVTFADKPSRGVLDALKAAGYRWGGGSWSGRTAALPEAVAAMEREATA